MVKQISHMSHDLGAVTIFRFLELGLRVGLGSLGLGLRLRLGLWLGLVLGLGVRIGIKVRILVRIIIQKFKNRNNP